MRLPPPGTQRTCAGAVRAFREPIRVAALDRVVVLVVDQVRSQSATVGRAGRVAQPRRAVLVVPTASGQAAHPGATVWWRRTGHVVANRLAGGRAARVAAAHQCFAAYTPADAPRLAA